MLDYRDRDQPVEILLVEDNQDDVLLTREGFRRGNRAANVYAVENGDRCIQFLRKQGEFADAPTPDLILLDLNMPVMDGREVLSKIASDEKFKHIPVIIMTTSACEEDILSMYQLGCRSYITKPVDFNRFEQVVQGINDYWFDLVRLPVQHH